MEEMKLVEKCMLVPQTPTSHRRLFLSNIDLTLVAYQENVSFFDPPPNNMSFSEVYQSLYQSLSRILVAYDFIAGRLVPAQEESTRLEIDCNGAGIVLVAVTTTIEMKSLGELRSPKFEYQQLVAFLHKEYEGIVELREKPLFLIQLTQFKCGGLAIASLSNHCILDGIAFADFHRNLAALSRGEDLVIMPNPDRTVFKARSPPEITHPHFEYSRSNDTDATFTVRGMCSNTIKQPLSHDQCQLINLSPERIARLKADATRDGSLTGCTIFHVVAAKIWKARSIAMQLQDEQISTMLFPVDVRRKIVPNAPEHFAGNAVVPGFARESVRELKMAQISSLVRKVQQGVERLSDEYVKSGMDWLEVHKGVPCRDNSFSVVAWGKLGFEGEEFSWGRLKCFTPIMVKPGLVMLLPGDKAEGGINICLELPSDQIKEFSKLLMED